MILIKEAEKKDYKRLLEIWERSVRATHDFISKKNIEEYKPLIMNHAFPAVELRCAVAGEEILGFVGVADSKIEMLFVDPDHFKKGIGKRLLNHAVEELKAVKVDVNEQNPEAHKFYEHMGFVVVERSPLDDQGNPFPILHMELKVDKNV